MKTMLFNGPKPDARTVSADLQSAMSCVSNRLPIAQSACRHMSSAPVCANISHLEISTPPIENPR